MAAGTTPIFPATPKTWYVQATAANTNRDGTGTTYTLATGAANASRVDRIRIHSTVTTTAGMARIYISLDNGTTKRLYKEVLMTAITASASVAAFDYDLTTPDLYLNDTNALVIVSINNAEATNFFAHGADF